MYVCSSSNIQNWVLEFITIHSIIVDVVTDDVDMIIIEKKSNQHSTFGLWIIFTFGNGDAFKAISIDFTINNIEVGLYSFTNLIVPQLVLPP